MSTVKALVVPADKSLPVREIELPYTGGGSLDVLQGAVGGHIEAVTLPEAFNPDGSGTMYVNADGKFTEACEYNPRATDFMVPGFGLFWGDYIAGDCVLAGVELSTGENADVPEAVVKRIRLIEREAT